MKKILDLVVVDNTLLANNYCLLKLSGGNEKLPKMFPGQFLQIKVDNSLSTFLRRPISINFCDEERNEIWILVQVIGMGTSAISKLNKGEVLNVIIPLGKSFSIPQNNTSKIMLIGGGVGIAPLLFQGKVLKSLGFEVNFLLGFRTKSDLLQIEEFEKYGQVFITTEDGSFGEKGYVTGHSVLNKSIDYIYTCGPKPMMQAVAKYSHSNNVECEVSLENMMACGFGTCLCCVEKTIKGNLCACTEGPVFNIKDLTWIN